MELQLDKIRSDYEDGNLSLREIGRKFSCSEGLIRKKAKAEGWYRNLDKKVAASVRSQLVRVSVRNPQSERAEREIVDNAATQIVEIAYRDRELIDRLEAILRGLLDELQYLPTEEDALNRLIEIGAAHEQEDIVKEMRKMTLSTEKRTALIKIMSEVAERLIKLHRLVYGMDAVAEPPSNILADVLGIIAIRSNNRCLPGSIDSL